jgi:anti-anti-sigma factor
LAAVLQPGSEIVVDVAELTFLDASGVGVLVKARINAEGQGNRLVVIDASPMARRIFEVTGLQSLLSGSDAL